MKTQVIAFFFFLILAQCKDKERTPEIPQPPENALYYPSRAGSYWIYSDTFGFESRLRSVALDIQKAEHGGTTYQTSSYRFELRDKYADTLMRKFRVLGYEEPFFFPCNGAAPQNRLLVLTDKPKGTGMPEWACPAQDTTGKFRHMVNPDTSVSGYAHCIVNMESDIRIFELSQAEMDTVLKHADYRLLYYAPNVGLIREETYKAGIRTYWNKLGQFSVVK